MTNITRRDLMKLAGGSILGILFTPVPWKLLDDTAIWTQNWSLTPKLPRGPIAFRHTTCPLCPAACGVKARTVSGIPTSLSGAAGHPVSRGALCPSGLAGHHAAFNPLRLSGPSRFSAKGPEAELRPVELEEILQEMEKGIQDRKEGELVAFLEMCSGRTISSLYRQFAGAIPGGVLLDPPNGESATVDGAAAMVGIPRGELGLDLEHARVIMGIGASLLEGWGTFGRMQSLARKAATGDLRIIQAESVRSETGRHASPWLPIAPGTEGALAFGLANILLNEGLLSPRISPSGEDLGKFKKLIAQFTPDRVSRATGIPVSQLEEVGRILARETPSVVISGANAAGGPLDAMAQRGIAALNLLLGAVGREGGIVRRRAIEPASGGNRGTVPINAIPGQSIRLLILDGMESGYGFPWGVIAPKLAEDALVISFSPAASGLALHADAIIPSPAPYERVADIPTPWDAPAATFAISAQILPPNEGSHDPRTVMLELAARCGLPLNTPATTVDAIKEITSRVHASRRGSVFSPEKQSSSRVDEIATADELYSMLEAGGVWIDDPLKQDGAGSFALCGNPEVEPAAIAGLLEPPPAGQGGLIAEITGVKGEIYSGHGSPLMTKIYQESGLRDSAGVARVNPATAEAHQLIDGSVATLRTDKRSFRCILRTDPSIHPKIIRVAAGPLPAGEGAVRNESEPFALCSIDQNLGWRYTPATLEKGE